MFFSSRGHESGRFNDVSGPFELSAYAPPLIWSSGSAYAIVEGHLDGSAKIRVIGNHNRDVQEFKVGPGNVLVRVGGPEHWVDDYHIQFQPISTTNGHLYASVYCGENLSEEDREIYHR